MYSADLRRSALHLYGLLQSLRKTSMLLNVGRSTIARWVQSHGVRKPYPQRRTRADLIVGLIRGTLSCKPFTTSHQLAELIHETLALRVSKELVRVATRKAGFTQKKAKFFGRPVHVAQKTADFVAERNKLLAAGRPFVSLDETSFGRHTHPVQGWAPRGHPLYAKRTPARITTTSVLTACFQDGRTASVQRHGSFNTVTFLDALKVFNIPSGSVVLLDNVRFHHAKVVVQYAESNNLTLLYVPPYSPWFNPVEGVFSVIKRSYYKHGSITDALNAAQPHHVRAFFKHSFALNAAPEFTC